MKRKVGHVFSTFPLEGQCNFIAEYTRYVNFHRMKVSSDARAVLHTRDEGCKDRPSYYIK